MKIDKAFNLKAHTSMKLGPEDAEALYIENTEDISSAIKYASSIGKKIHVLGEGTNSFFEDGISANYVFLISDIKKFEVSQEKNNTTLKLGSGLLWDEAVAESVKRGFSGLEALSGIPGTVGAAPIQNIGAYGREVQDILLSLEAYDIEKNVFIKMSKTDCEFSYRDSIFKKNPGKYFIVSVTLQVSDLPPQIPDYKDVKSYFSEKQNTNPSAQEIREAIIEIRARKLPNYKTQPNMGSYFKNPIIEDEKLKKILENYTDLPHFKAHTGFVKVPAGWLIEKAGFKGVSDAHFGVYEKNALVLVGDGEGTVEELLALEEKIREKVFEMFEIKLEREPVLVN